MSNYNFNNNINNYNNGVNLNNNVNANNGSFNFNNNLLNTNSSSSLSLNSNCTSFNTISNNNVNSLNTNSNFTLQTLKRRTNKVVVPLDERVTLERAYGFTIGSNARLSQSCDGIIAYLAGCVIVLYDPNRQSQDFIISQARKTLTTVAFSYDGKSIATGESGHEPKVRVWDVRDKIQIAEFGGHKFSIECVCFSSNINSNLIVSIGSMHDMVVNVWNLKTKFKVASNKIACKVKGIAFSRDGAYFVTVGNRHVKFWYLTVSSLMETVPLKGRAAILGDMKNNYFCDVACGGDECSHMTYTITTNGVLCEFNENRSLSRAIELRAEKAYCIYSDNSNLFIGCSNGTIHIFRQKNLSFIASLPRPHSLGVDIAKGLDTRHLVENLSNPDVKYPDCVALCYDQYDCILSAIYNDHSFYIWDIKDFNKVKKLDSHLFHSSCCWALDLYSPINNNNPMSCLPADSFVTCSTDNTLRIWSSVSPNANQNNNNYKLKRNIYSKELLKIIYIDNDISGLCEIDQSIANSSDNSDLLSSTNSSIQPSSKQTDNAITNLPVSTITNFSCNDGNGNNLKMGARCIKINPHGVHMATGDRNGNIRIYDLNTLESICMIEAHDGEVLYLQYSQPESGKLLLASSSRDRLIHIFDASKSTYDLLQTLDDHSAAITAVRFCFNQAEKQLYVISCGADKSIMFRTATQNSENSSQSSSPSFNTPSSNSQQLQFVRTSYVAEKQTFYDLNLDTTRNCINTISQDRMIRAYSIKDGKKVRQFKGSLNEDGYLLKMDTDRSGSLLATSCTDKCVYVWDLNTSECVAYLYGHSEVVTDLKFTSDNQHLITVGGDGCIFVWKLNNLPTHTNANMNTINTHLPLTSSNSYPSTNSLLSPVSPGPSLSFSTCRKQNSLSSSSQPPNYLLPTTPVRHQQSLDTIFDNDHDSLPAWARNKLINSENFSSPLVASPNHKTFNFDPNSPEILNSPTTDLPTRRSRAVWGPVLNTNFAIMDETETHSNNLSHATIMSPSSTSIKSNNDPDLKGGELNFKIDDEYHENNEMSNDLIPFPSPSVDNDLFHIKQLNITKTELDKKLINDDDDMLEYKEETFEIEHEVRIVTEPDQKSQVLNRNCLDSPRQPSTSLKLEVNDETSSENGSLKNSMLSPFNRSNESKDGFVKFDSDMDNSFKRQSISARYLMKTQLQKQQTPTSEQKSPPIKMESSNQKNNTSFNKSKESDANDCNSSIDMNTPVKINSTIASTHFGLASSAQMAADLLKIRRKSSILNNLTHSSTSPSINSLGSTNNLNNITSNPTQPLYNQHTESSLNKTKTKSVSNESSQVKSNNLSVSVSNMKRSPSVNSLNQNETLKSKNDSSTTVQRHLNKINNNISVKHHNTSNKHILSVSNKNNTNGNNSTDSDDSSNLKKAVSMLSLYSKNQNNNNTASATNNTYNNSKHILVSGSPKHVNSTPTSSSSSITTGNTLLPPKTVRQLKQRSAERQLTSSIITINSNRPSLASTPTTQINPIETFSEQSKHLRKLSNSVQNLHQSQQMNTQQSSINLPPQPPRSPSKSPQLGSSKNEPITKSKKSTSPISNRELKTKRVAETITSAKMSEVLIIDQIKRIDSDQMSSSSSHNDDYIENNQLDNDDNSNVLHQSNQFQTSSNSLTSSSSSSCSLFEAMNQVSSRNNDLHMDTNSNLNQTLTKLDELSNSNENKLALSKNELKLNLNKSTDLTRPTELDFNLPTSNSHLYNNSNGNNSNSIGPHINTTFSGLKKPITFAAIAAANSPNAINVCSLTTSANVKNQLTNDKIESILKEFKHNIFLLDLIYNQASKNLEEYIKFQEKSASIIQSSAVNSPHQTIHLIQTFNSTINSLVKQFNPPLTANANKLSSNGPILNTTNTNTNANNSESNKNADLELI